MAYKAIVIVNLIGGNDSWNMVVPTATTPYATYATSRGDRAIDSGDLVSISPAIAGYGMHPDLDGIASRINSSKGSVIANIGTLVEPTTKAQIAAGSVQLPPQLFSHSDQQLLRQLPYSLRGDHGWAGRMMDVLGYNDPLSRINMIGGTFSIIQEGLNNTIPYVIKSTGPEPPYGMFENGSVQRRLAFDEIISSTGSITHNALAGATANKLLSSYDLYAELITRLSNASIATTFPTTNLGRQLKTAAQILSVRDTMPERQVIVLSQPDYDTHDNADTRQPLLFAELDAALSAFIDELDEQREALGTTDDVVVWVHSEFGRTLSPNSTGGSDHGWGGVELLFGDTINSGTATMFGTWPNQAIGSADDMPEATARGRLIPTTGHDQIAHSLATWFGLSSAQANQLFNRVPGLGGPVDVF